MGGFIVKKYLIALVAAFAVTSVASAVDFNQRAYECVTTHEVFASILHRVVRGRKETEKYPRASYNPTSFSVGYVHRRDSWHAGLAFNYEGGKRKLNYRGVSGYKVDTGIPGFSLFAGTTTPNGIYVNAHTFFGFASYKAKNGWNGANQFGTGNKIHKTLFALGVEAGKIYDIGFCGLLATPHIGLDYAYAPSERYNWNGAVWDSIKSQSYFEIPLGVSLSKPLYASGGWVITPKIDATLITSLGKMDPYNAHPGFAFRTADQWKVQGISAGRVGGRISAGVDASIGERLKVGVGYAFEGRNRYRDHRLTANLALAF